MTGVEEEQQRMIGGRGGLADDTTQREELSRLIEESHINFSAERVIYL